MSNRKSKLKKTRDEWLDAESLRLSRLALKDLGLTMPCVTAKYDSAVRLLVQIQQTSCTFIHMAAAEGGSQRLYKWLAEYGYECKDGQWSEKVNSVKSDLASQ